MAIYKYFAGFREKVQQVKKQSLKDDLAILDDLYGRKNLQFDSTDSDVKKEALRQLEIEYRQCENEQATFWVNVKNCD